MKPVWTIIDIMNIVKYSPKGYCNVNWLAYGDFEDERVPMLV